MDKSSKINAKASLNYKKQKIDHYEYTAQRNTSNEIQKIFAHKASNNYLTHTMNVHSYSFLIY